MDTSSPSSSPAPAAPPQWIECNAWELDLYGLPHRIPWPADADPKVAEQSPFDAGLLLNAIEDLGEQAGPPWTTFLKASEHFDELAEALQDNEFPTAQRLLDEIERLHPGSTFTQFHRAHVARHDGRVEESIALYKTVAERVPRFGFVWTNLGATLAAEGRREEAVAAYLNAVRAVPNDQAALEGLASLRAAVKVQRDPKDPNSVAYLDLPTFAKMAGQQIAVLEKNPEQLQAFGEQLLRDGFAPQVALQALEKVRELRPNDPRVLMALAAAYRQAGRKTDSRKLAEEFTQKHPDDAGGWLHLAQNCHADGDTDAETKALDRALQLDPNMQPALMRRFGLTEDPQSKEAEARIVAFGDERNAWMPYLVASAMARDRGDLPIALRYARQALDIEPENEDVLLHTGALLGQMKDVVELSNLLEQPVSSGKYSKRLDWNYAQALKSCGRVNEAVQVLINAASAEGTPDDFKQAAASTIDFWNGLLAESGTHVEVLKAGVLARPILLRLDDEDGAVVLNAGQLLPVEGKFPWRVPPDGRPETRIHFQQGQTGSSLPPRDLGYFIVRGLPPVTSGAHTLQCRVAAAPHGTVIFQAILGNREMRVAWEPPMEV